MTARIGKVCSSMESAWIKTPAAPNIRDCRLARASCLYVESIGIPTNS